MERVIVLSGERISLVIPEMEDLDIMLKAINNVEISTYLGPIRHQTRQTEEKYLKNLIEEGKKQFMIMINDSKKIIGSVGFNEEDAVSRNGLIGICLYDEKEMSKGYGSEAMELFLKYVFKYLGYHKVKLNVFLDNTRAIKSYKKVGFREVGIYKQDVYIMGEYKDQIAMELLRSEYSKV